ncbi:MAG: Unknown protein [uncultured Campylobacterales bacterium]|uniref:DUF4279 domain-containing protein n=1 Tax=uncultured Campylobacterales bacterium TaxID=352960 RepID=A0A6S6S8Q6_9BACT|nr:MAG: Unknown protein [uncultured Campylobacterales bacterium]
MIRKSSLTDKIIFKINFCIYPDDNFDINTITSLLNIKASKIKLKGAKGSYTKYKDTSWNYSISSTSIELNEAFDKLLNVFIDKVNILKKIQDKAVINIDIQYFIYNKIIPAICLSEEQIKFLANFNCSLDCDGYLYS